jgi:hypothetical protein
MNTEGLPLAYFQPSPVRGQLEPPYVFYLSNKQSAELSVVKTETQQPGKVGDTCNAQIRLMSLRVRST